eukprot:5063922-Amphidinium_carterae.1
MRERQTIQKNHTSDVLCELSRGDTLHKNEVRRAPLGLAHTPPRGCDNMNEIQVDYEVGNLSRKQTSLSVRLFNMVAELAIAKRVRELAIEFA